MKNEKRMLNEQAVTQEEARPDTMKSAIYLGKGSVDIREVPVPEFGPRDVLVKNIRSSICGTDAAVYKNGPDGGHRITVGGEFGHETVSRIVAVGSEISPENFQIGERVYPYPRNAKNDPTRSGTLGAFSEYILIPEAKPGHSLYRVPDAISDEEACMIEPFTVGMRVARRSAPHAGEKAMVFGAGTIGIAAAIALKFFGLEKVMIADLSNKRLSLARGLGFEVCDISREDLLARAETYFGSSKSLRGPAADVDIFLDAAGADSVLSFFMEKGKIGSRFVEVAVGGRARTVDFVELSFSQKSLIGSGGYMPEDVEDVLAIMKSHIWDIAGIVTHAFGIEDLETALRIAGDPERSLNVQIVF